MEDKVTGIVETVQGYRAQGRGLGHRDHGGGAEAGAHPRVGGLLLLRPHLDVVGLEGQHAARAPQGVRKRENPCPRP